MKPSREKNKMNGTEVNPEIKLKKEEDYHAF